MRKILLLLLFYVSAVLVPIAGQDVRRCFSCCNDVASSDVTATCLQDSVFLALSCDTLRLPIPKNSKVEMKLANQSGSLLATGASYTMECLQNGVWSSVKEHKGAKSIAFVDVLIEVKPYSTFDSWAYLHPDIYNLKRGKYRFVKEYKNVATGKCNKVYAEFTII